MTRLQRLICVGVLLTLPMVSLEAGKKKQAENKRGTHHKFQKGQFTKKGKYRKGHEKTQADGNNQNNRSQSYGK